MSPVIAMPLCPGSTLDTVVNCAFYHVFQDDEGRQTRYAQTLHGDTEPVARLFMLELGTPQRQRPSMARRAGRTPSYVAVEPRCAMAAAQEATAFDRITCNRRRGLNHGRMLLCHLQSDCRRGIIGPCGSCWSRSL